MVKVHAELWVSLQDQPERRGANCIDLGNSNFAARWGHSGNLNPVASLVPSCTACVDKHLGNNCENEEELPQFITEQCKLCADWETSTQSGLLDFNPPDDFPPSEIPPSGKLKPKVLSHSMLVAAVRKTHEMVSTGQWEVKNGKAFLATFAINDNFRCKVTENAWNAWQLSLATQNKNTHPEEHSYMMKRLEMDPQDFSVVKLPALWVRGALLTQHIDVVMHLVFLGVIKTCVQHTQLWATKRNKHTGFLRHVENVLESIQSLSLNWCKALPCSQGKLGGWVSENCLAFS